MALAMLALNLPRSGLVQHLLQQVFGFRLHQNVGERA